MYVKTSMIVCKSCCKPKITIIVPPLGRMNTNANRTKDYKVEPLFGLSRSEVNMAMSSTILERLFQKLQGIFRKLFDLNGLRYNKYTTTQGWSTRPCIDASGQPNINLCAALLRLILGWPRASIHSLVLHPWLVVYLLYLSVIQRL